MSFNEKILTLHVCYDIYHVCPTILAGHFPYCPIRILTMHTSREEHDLHNACNSRKQFFSCKYCHCFAQSYGTPSIFGVQICFSPSTMVEPHLLRNLQQRNSTPKYSAPEMTYDFNHPELYRIIWYWNKVFQSGWSGLSCTHICIAVKFFLWIHTADDVSVLHQLTVIASNRVRSTFIEPGFNLLPTEQRSRKSNFHFTFYLWLQFKRIESKRFQKPW